MPHAGAISAPWLHSHTFTATADDDNFHTNSDVDDDDTASITSVQSSLECPNTGVRRPLADSTRIFYGRLDKGAIGTHKWLRWPLLFAIMTLIMLELLLYFVLRLVVALYESCVFCMFQKYRHEVERLQNASSYEEWHEAAVRLDSLDGLDFWKTVDRSPFYDWEAVKEILAALDLNTISMADLCAQLSRVFNYNSAVLGLDNECLYAETRSGTKLLVQRFISKVVESVVKVRDCESIPLSERLDFFEKSRRAYGRSALCLSSGASMSFYHFGVVKALLDQNLLPDVICGSSGGALVAAMVCTRTPRELKRFLSPKLYRYLTGCDESWRVLFTRYWREGAVFDEKLWRKKLRLVLFNDMTFEEAYARTGRVLNIACTHSRKSAAPILLNHISAPDVVIWTAVLASSAIPPLLKPMRLLRKRDDGSLEPFVDFGLCWSDGHIKADIPSKALAEAHNCNFLIVSQTNPHIAPFFFESRGSDGRPNLKSGTSFRGGFISSALETFLKLEMKKWLRMLHELDLMPMIFATDFSSMYLQRLTGDVTMHPSRGWRLFADFTRLVSNPSEEDMKVFLDQGMRVCWPKINRIHSHLRFEQALRDAHRHLLRLVNSPSP